MLCYVMWNLFIVGSLQFCNDSAIASLEANQNRPKAAAAFNTPAIISLNFAFVSIRDLFNVVA